MHSRFMVVEPVTVMTCAVVSCMVTVAVHELELPDVTNTVTVTELAPRSAQVNESGLAVVAPSFNAQLSELPADNAVISPEVNVYAPDPSRERVIGLHTAVGASVSNTVTAAMHESELPTVSYTVTVTFTVAPRLAHENVSGVTVVAAVSMAQLSVLPVERDVISAGVNV